MPPRIFGGNKYDDARAKTDVILNSPNSNLEVHTGDLHDRAQEHLTVEDNSGQVGSPASPPLPVPHRGMSDKLPHSVQNDASGSRAKTSGPLDLWARGAFFLVAFLTVAGVIGTLAYELPWYFVPLSVVGAILALYLLAIILQPEGALSEKGLLSVLKNFVRLAFAARPEQQADSKQPTDSV
jgi:hypothetical protein